MSKEMKDALVMMLASYSSAIFDTNEKTSTLYFAKNKTICAVIFFKDNLNVLRAKL